VSASGDLGFTAGTYEDSFKGPDGKLVTEKGKYVSTWRKEKGRQRDDEPGRGHIADLMGQVPE
jgi:ketosteroid isomerase-like protein